MEFGMMRSIPKKNRLMRTIFRFPIVLYRLHMGWLLGKRFLMLTHTGRKSGKHRHVVVEVVDHDYGTNTFYIASGWGEKSDWFMNIQQNPETIVQVGNDQFATRAAQLTVDESERRLRIYAEKHPTAFRELSGLILGEHIAPTADNARRLAHKVPVVALRPLESANR
jgi:deazaflavin-dependent oxidoreductase (nitroreductase family)